MNHQKDRLSGYNIYPTPFHEMNNLRKKAECKPRIFIKRDDMTMVGLGGNKNRKLDYLMKDALDKKADVIVTWGGVQSNHCRQTLAYAKILGFECHLVLNGSKYAQKQGNHFVFDIFGAKIHYETDESKCMPLCEEIAKELSKEGKIPYVIPVGASTPLGSLGYIDSIKEIAEQSKAAEINVGHIFLASGSAGTQAGAEIGAKLFMPNCKIHGVAVSRGKAEQAEKVSKLCAEIAELIGERICIPPQEIIVHDEYYDAYAVPTKAGNKAIKTLGKTQGIMLDPVYSGKAMSAMLDLLKKGTLDDSEAVVFIHTGGSPAVYNYNNSFYRFSK